MSLIEIDRVVHSIDPRTDRGVHRIDDLRQIHRHSRRGRRHRHVPPEDPRRNCRVRNVLATLGRCCRRGRGRGRRPVMSGWMVLRGTLDMCTGENEEKKEKR